MAKTSRRMPATPVAAPWNGSTALGWLWDSTLKATARPSPMSTAPAFSPGPSTTRSPSVGSVPSSFLECLYEQCSLHMSENIASSTWLGSRPSLSQTRRYSSGVSPRETASSTLGSNCCMRHGAEEDQAVGRAGQRIDRMLGVGHQAEDVALLVAHAGDSALGAVVVGGVAQHDLVGDRVEVGRVVAAGGVLDRDREPLADRRLARERGVGGDDLELGLAADEAQLAVGQQRARQQAGLAQDLEAVADPQDDAAVAGELDDRLHDRGEARDRADAQVVAVREPARDHDRVDALQVAVGVPQQHRLADALAGQLRVDLVTRAGEPDDAELHEEVPPRGIRPRDLRSRATSGLTRPPRTPR